MSLPDDVRIKKECIRSLEGKLRVAECEDLNKSTALSSTQDQLALLSQQQTQTSVQLEEAQVQGSL